MTFNCDNTKLVDHARCEASAIARHVFGLRGKGEKIAADIGNAYHAGLELHFKSKSKREVTHKFEREYDKVIPPGEQPEEARFARPNCIKIMERYCDTRPVDKFPFEIVEFEQVKGVELEPGSGIIFWVKRDMLGKDRQSGMLSPIDHKTTGRLTSWWSRKFRLTSQLSGYAWFTQQEHGQTVEQVYVNGLEIGKLPDSNRKCASHGVKYSECGVEHANFQLYQYARTQEQLEKWKQDAIIIAKKAKLLGEAFGSDISLLKYAFRNGAFNDACMFCEHKDWCVADFNPSMAEGLTVFERWEPWGLEGAVRVDV